MLHLDETDLRFLVETVATNRQDHDQIADLIRNKDDLLEVMLGDPKLVHRLLQEEENLIRVSPYFLFTALLLKVRRELADRTYILEVDFKGKRIPVFEAKSVAGLLADSSVRDYLAEMLASFTRTKSGVLYWKERGAWHKRRFMSRKSVSETVKSCRSSEVIFSQAGRRGFDHRLPLHVFNNLGRTEKHALRG
jgi:hypothetical protein